MGFCGCPWADGIAGSFEFDDSGTHARCSMTPQHREWIAGMDTVFYERVTRPHLAGGGRANPHLKFASRLNLAANLQL